MINLIGIAMLIGVINGIRVAMNCPRKEDPGLALLAGAWCGFACTLLATPFVFLLVAIFF